ncbi:uncharacterized protein B0I36DRAFT_435083 [Microdochium trichocladiopsis]|uniref:Adhesin domain-containing protein n=1 Tax=Microdochium trichocladiopsis TaxID=1682393 RepID=A0A9P8XY83_9PEZI|nr:uncharacterized protein B0I36DRAFT_435083 [Microdochium trichocladiopsis]KAH7021210.1 hypothetical protein B0I36DRAFT_435083 [Microdochium trichocladiopsis]
MPYADDLYSGRDGPDSGDDGDDQHLSPSDGYFAASSSGSHVPQVMVQDPDVARRHADDAAAKAREAAAHHPPPPSSTSTIPRSTLIHARPPSVYSDAPPAYSPSASTPLSPTTNRQDNDDSDDAASRHSIPANYNTFGPPSTTMGSPRHAEYDPLLGRNPQSMSGRPADEEAGTSPPWKHNYRSIRSRLPAWLNWKVVLGGIILLAIALAFIATPFSGAQDKESTLKPAKPIDSTPGEPGEGPSAPGNAPIFSPSYCRDAKFRFDDLLLPLDAHSAKDITFIEDLYDGEGRSSVSVSGSVTIRQAKDGQKPEMRMQMVTDYEDLRLKVVLDNSAQLMKISVPRRTDSDFPPRLPCLEIRTTIWLPADAKVGKLNVDVISLGIYTLDDLSLELTNMLTLSSISGDIGSGMSSIDQSLTMPSSYATPPNAYKLNSRVVKVGTTSGKIGGHYPLYDILDLHTTSGNIDVSITPHEILSSAPESAALTIHTTSGSIHAAMPIRSTSNVPDRDYVTSIKGVSGTLHLDLIQGSKTVIKTTSGGVDLILLPVIDLGSHSPSSPATLETSTTSSHLNVEILDPIWFGSANTIPTREIKPTPYEPVGDGSPLNSLLPPSVGGDLVTAIAGSSTAARKSGNSQSLNLLKATHKTTSGSIVLHYPEAWQGDLHAATTSGSIKITGRDVHKISGHDGWVGHDITVRKGSSGNASKTEVSTLSGSVQAYLGLA